MRYLIDSNVFISAKNSHYGMDFCPAFWDWVDRQHAEDRLHSVEKVGDELMLGKDRLADWAKHRGKDFFLPTDEATLNAYKVVSQWVHLQKYESAQENNFFQGADYFLVAYALAHQCTIVTHEIRQTGAKKVKIPNVCDGVNVKYLTPFEMLRRERAKFVLEAPQPPLEDDYFEPLEEP